MNSPKKVTDLGLRVLTAEHALYPGDAGLEKVLERLLGVPGPLAPLGVLCALQRQPQHHVVQRAEHRPVVWAASEAEFKCRLCVTIFNEMFMQKRREL